MGTYSVIYTRSCQDDREANAVDWGWKVRGEWTGSNKEWTFGPWCQTKFDEETRAGLLEHFGLESWADEFPGDRIIFMSPRELALERRSKEQKYDLPRKEMFSDTLGYHVKAEDHSDAELCAAGKEE